MIGFQAINSKVIDHYFLQITNKRHAYNLKMLISIPYGPLGFLYGFFCQNVKFGPTGSNRIFLILFGIFHFAVSLSLFSTKMEDMVLFSSLLFLSNLSLGAICILILG